ncbi:hypothetical protein PAXRUDRAFT_16216 [Paxillus rubicundulus Ve08.2h10]|uniref:Uncharacterized protein n=1 Tax=Paxillus rubicundulus Ve08.2h10 TaxID=930991 RepID=A0A0D0D7I9_9AGAM|nr:hypothetical protein PAXRUDRAFT_16216 [Paxillus rubicundulus Ve08.2h10]
MNQHLPKKTGAVPSCPKPAPVTSLQTQCTSHSTSYNAVPVASLGDLTPIPEHDKADSMTMNEDINISTLPQDALRNADQFLSVITAAGTSKPGYVELDELDKDSEGASKKMDIVEDQDGTTQVGSDDEESNLELDYLLKHKTIIRVKTYDSDDDAPKHFTIQCMAPHPDGSNAPFSISFTTTLNVLRDIVAEKMEWFPTLVHLQYCIDSDKAKQTLTSIQTTEEFTVFKGHLQSLIIPGRLPSGHMSTHAPKNPLIHFEDTSIGGGGPHTSSNKGGAKASGMTSGTAKQKPTSAGELDGANCHQKLIKELQEQWKCDEHSKNGTETNKWCYTPSNGGGCQPLTISNLSFWAIKIMEGTTMIDEKPISLSLDTVHSHLQNNNQPAVMPSMGQPGGFGFNGYPIFFIPQCRGNPQGGASTPWPLPPPQATAQPQSQGTQLSGQSLGQLGLAPP